MLAKKFAAAACLLVASASLFAIEDLPRSDLWVTNGRVNTGTQIGNTLYIGGEFNYVGPLTGHGAELNSTTAALIPGFPKINGQVNCVVPDGTGGWFIGGDFIHVNGQTRNRLIHVLSNGALDFTFNPNVDGTVRCMVLDGTTLYFGGTFTNVNNVSRSRLAAVSTVDGSLTTFDVSVANGSVDCMALNGTELYIGGEFTTVGILTRDNVARIITTGTGSVDTWNIPVTGGSFPRVSCMKYIGSLLYIGGAFTTVSDSRSNLAAITTGATASVDGTFDPVVNNQVFAMDTDGTRLYIGGTFSEVDSQPLNRTAAITLSTGSADLTWDPVLVGDIITSVCVSGSDVYLVGDIDTAGAGIATLGEGLAADIEPRHNIVRVGTNSVISPWAPIVTGYPRAVAVSGSKVFVGGDLQSMGGVLRNGLAALDLSTGEATSWNPDAGSSSVYAMIAIGDTLYFGGDFGTVGGITRNQLAAVDTAGNLQPWNPNISSGTSVNSLATDGTSIFVGGTFATIGAETRQNLAKVDSVNGTVDTTWNPSPNQSIFAVRYSNNVVYAGGSFTTIDGKPRNYIAALDPATGTASAWAPNPDDNVHTIEINADSVYFGGAFSNLLGDIGNAGDESPRDNLAEVTTAGAVTSFNAMGIFDGAVDTLTLNGSTIVVGGNFFSPNQGVVELNRSNGVATAWNPGIGLEFEVGVDVEWVYASSGFLYVGGSFLTLGTNEEFTASNFAAFALGNPFPTGITPNIGSTAGGSTVTINGSGFATGATVLFGTNSATNVSVIDANTITCVTPAGAVGPVNITITNPDATTGLLENGFTYVDPGTPPTVSASADRLSAATGTTINFTAAATDPDSPNLTISWDFKDGTSGAGSPVAHAFSIPGEFAVTVTVSDGFNSVSASVTVTIFSAASGGDGVKNISENKPPVSNPLNGISIAVERSNGGVIDLSIDVDSLTRDAFDVETAFDGLVGRNSVKGGTKISEKFDNKGLVVATSTAKDAGTQNARGKARKTLAVSSREVGEPIAFTNPPADTTLQVKSLKGKFVFSALKSDTVTYQGQVELPEGLDLTQEQELQFGMGNVVDKITIDKKGKGKGSPTTGRIKKVQIKYPRVDKKNPVTKSGQIAKITITYVAADLPGDGFDTEGISPEVRADEVGKKSTSRSIQTAMVLAGVAYEAQVPVEYKVTPKQDAGSLIGRSVK